MGKQLNNNHQVSAEQNDSHIITPSNFVPSSAVNNKSKRHVKAWQVVLATVFALAFIILWYLFSAKSVVVTTAPVTTNLKITKGFYFELADHFLMRPAQYEVSATLSGYYPIKKTFTVKTRQNQQFHFNFIKLPGNVKLNISPLTSVQVTIDGKTVTVNKSNTVENISAGSHHIKIISARYFLYETQLEVKGKQQTQRLNVVLRPAWAAVTLDSTPQNAQVFANDVVLGFTPLTTELIEGRYQLKYKKNGYALAQREANIIAGQNVTLSKPRLNKLMAQLEINTKPNDVSVTYGEQYLGKTPLKVKVLPDKRQKLSLFKSGYQAQSFFLTVGSGKTVNKAFTLTPILGELTFNTQPADALLYVDDVLLGRADQKITLPTKKYHIRIKKAGFADYIAEVLPNESLEQIFNIKLKTLEQVKWENMKPFVTSASGNKLKLFKPNDTFVMGASRREQGRRANEIKRTIHLNKPFYLGVTEITNKQFRQFNREHSSSNLKGNSLNGERQPVVKVSWLQAVKFCNWLSKQEHLTQVYQMDGDKVVSFNNQANGYRLPTEAEWAWAARYQNHKMIKYDWGNSLTPPSVVANIADVSAAAISGNIQATYNDGYIVSAPVASFAANKKGIYDLSGNVSEWIHDFYAIKTGLSLKSEENPMGPILGDFHVIRGASWAQGGRIELRLSYRDYGKEQRNDLGFRLARYAQ